MRITAEVVARRAVALWRARSAMYTADRCVDWPTHSEDLPLGLCLTRVAEGDLDPGDACEACKERVRLKGEVRKAQGMLTSGVKSYARTLDAKESIDVDWLEKPGAGELLLSLADEIRQGRK